MPLIRSPEALRHRDDHARQHNWWEAYLGVAGYVCGDQLTLADIGRSDPAARAPTVGAIAVGLSPVSEVAT